MNNLNEEYNKTRQTHNKSFKKPWWILWIVLLVLAIVFVVFEVYVQLVVHEVAENEVAIPTGININIKQDESRPAFNIKDSLNYTDSKGLKQGKWIEEYKGEIVKIENYVNDTLHGYWASTGGCWRKERFYYKGLMDSVQVTYYDYTSNNILGFWKYDKGKYIWGACYAANVEYLIPPKRFFVENDSTWIIVNHPNGNHWYKGFFRKERISRDSIHFGLMTFPVGIHHIYFKNGNLKGIVDYDKEEIEEYDIDGNQLYKTNFKDVRTHKQIIY